VIVFDSFDSDCSTHDLLKTSLQVFKIGSWTRRSTRSHSSRHGTKMRQVPIWLPVLPSEFKFVEILDFELVARYVHRAGYYVVVVVLYRPGSRTVTNAFLTTWMTCWSVYRPIQHHWPSLVISTFMWTTWKIMTLVSCWIFLPIIVYFNMSSLTQQDITRDTPWI